MRDLMVGVPVAGRTRAELEGLIGLFVNILPIRGDLSGNPTFEEFLDQIRDTTLSGYAHEALSFERMVELVNPTRDVGFNPLIQVTCQLFEENGTEGLQIEELAVERLALEIPSSRFDLSLDLTGQVDGLRGEFIYDADLFDRGTMEGLAEAFQALLCEVTQDPTCPVWAIPLRLDDRPPVGARAGEGAGEARA
jgi:non-ribosomal peptide synthetase component F